MGLQSGCRRKLDPDWDPATARDGGLSIWQRLSSFFWSLLFRVLVGKQLPRLSLLSPPCANEDREPDSSKISLPGAFEGTHILITGAGGYIGSLVLEQILRLCPKVSKVYIIVRNRKGMPSAQRMRQLMKRPLFNQLRRQHRDFDAMIKEKVVILNGDLELPECGLTGNDHRMLCARLHAIIHCAANTSFTDPLHTLLRNNYWATSNLTSLARSAQHLKGFTHVSTAYVSSILDPGSHVEEKIFPLGFMNGHPIEHAKVAKELGSLDPEAAAASAAQYLRASRHCNNYTFSKHMTEHLMRDLHKAGVPVTIVRPAIVGAVAYEPCPGYFGNTVADVTAVMLAYATGIGTFTCHNPTSVFDVIPGDICASTILAASAAIIQDKRQGSEPFIVHSASSTSHPAQFETLFQEYVWPFWSQRRSKFAPTTYSFPKPEFNPWRYPLAEDTPLFKLWTVAKTAKLWILSTMLQLFNQKRLALRLWSGWKAFKLYNTEKLDFKLFFCSRNSRWLQDSLAAVDVDAGVRTIWEPPHDDWRTFLLSFQHAVYEAYFKGPKVLGQSPCMGEEGALQAGMLSASSLPLVSNKALAGATACYDHSKHCSVQQGVPLTTSTHEANNLDLASPSLSQVSSGSSEAGWVAVP